MLAEILGSETRARIVALLTTQPRRSYHVRELVREVGTGTSGVQREIARLEGIGLITTERGADGRRLVRLVSEHPLAAPLAGLVVAESPAAYGSPAEEVIGINPHTAPFVARIVELCRDAGVERVVLFGSSTQPGWDVVPNDVDLLVKLGGPVRGSAGRFFELKRSLEDLVGKEVDLVDERAVLNAYLRAELDRTGVVIHEAA